MIKKVFTLEKGKVVDCKTDGEEAPLGGSLSYLKALAPTSRLKALQKARLGKSGLATDSGGHEEARSHWDNSSRFIKTKDGKSAVVLGDQIILEQG